MSMTSGQLPAERTVDARPPIDKPLPLWQASPVVAVLVGIVATAIALIRVPWVGLSTLWAEDGSQFLTGSLTNNGAFDAFTPYAGYLHFVPRLISQSAVDFIPVDSWALFMSISSCVVLGAVSALAFVLVRDLIPWFPARLALALVPALAPLVATELIGNVANLHWFFLWLGPLILIGRVNGRFWVWALAVVALAMTLTEALLLVFVPLMFFASNKRARLPIFTAYLLGLAAQIIAYLSAPRPGVAPSGWSAGIRSTIIGYITSVSTGAVTNQNVLVGTTVLKSGLAIPAILTIVFIVITAWVVWRGSRAQRVYACALIVASGVLWAAGYLLNQSGFGFTSYGPTQWMEFTFRRHAVLPSLLLLSIIPLAAQIAWTRMRRVAAVSALVALAAILAMSFASPYTMRENGPEWARNVDAAREQCSDGVDVARIDIAPQGWATIVPCDRLILDHSREK
ncbi:hypothetical protein [Plantibacter sp. YIM 135347]|uniref:hypothetical protein n=1 Tax=Plantibacter sp. YIM 135347 TaxID=3423919 RepID=UPI003D32DC55